MLGEALVSLGYVTKEQIDEALAAFLKEEEEYLHDLMKVPDEVPVRDLAERLFRLTHTLLFRAWGLRNKPGELLAESEAVLLSDRNAQVDLTGDVNVRLLFAITHAVAEEPPPASTEEGEEEEEAAAAAERPRHNPDERVLTLADMVCRNLVGALQEENRSVEMSAPREVAFRVPLEGGAKALVMPYYTNLGQIFSGIVYQTGA
jgi:hypothetical protein